MPEAKWILSGINHGANLGADIYYSGTVAAVREALLHGWPGIAFSLYRKSGVEADWKRAERWSASVADLLARPIEPGILFQVDLPLLSPDAPDPEVVWCPLDPKPLPLNYRHEAESGLYYAGDYNLRHRRPAPMWTSASAETLQSRRSGFSDTSLTSHGGPQYVEKKSRGEPFGEDEEHELVLTISRDVERMRHCQRKVDPEAISVQP